MLTGVAIAIVAIVMVASFAKWRSRHMVAVRECHEIFYKAAGNLVKDGDTPEVVLRFTGKLSNNLRNARALRSSVWMLLWKSAPSDKSAELDSRELQEALDKMPERLRNLFGQVVVSGLLAMSHESAVIGTIVRRLVFMRIRAQKRARDQEFDKRMVEFAEGVQHCA